MIADVVIALAAPIAGFFTALWLLLIWVGDEGAPLEPERDLDLFLSVPGEIQDDETHAPLIPMPEHLKTRDEMVAWMTQELPKLMQN